MGHPLRSLVFAAFALGLTASSTGCALNAEGEGLYGDRDGGVSGGGSGGAGGWIPDAEPEDVSVKDVIPDVPPPPDVPCFPPKKVCGSECDFPDPIHMGCSPTKDDCDPCPEYPNADAVCLNNGCAMSACYDGFADCTSAAGCETSTNSLDDCGACGVTCSRANAVADCSLGYCRYLTCNNGFADCDGDETNGCEVNLYTLDHCGACDAPLCEGPGPAVYTCVTGECKVDKCTTPLTADCDADEGNGCEVNLATLADCGACGIACARTHATATCATGTCAIAQCDTNYGDCNFNEADGCETNTSTSALNCGTCGAKCETTHTTATSCQASVCVTTCENGWADCNGPQPGSTDDGCEVNVAADATNCGGCGNVCSSTNIVTPTCAGGLCNGTCANGYDDCDANKLTNGCEINLLNDVNNCGSCGHVCSTNGGTAGCSNGQCTITCSAGRANCDGDVANGCEINLTTNADNCGSCSKACSANHMQTRTCAASLCNGTCAAGFADCNANKQTDGCEISTATDPDNCGTCTTVCSPNHMQTRTCGAGVCNGTCASGWGDCDNNKLTNGCETDLNTTATHCGGCGQACSANNIVRACSGGQCTGTCNPGFVDCNVNKRTDGCEINTTNNADNCGGCGTVCSNVHMQTRTCSASLCNGTCATGYADCDSNKQTTGCEQNIATDPDHCGTCTAVCSSTNMATRTCGAGLCNGTCSAGFGDCDSNKLTTGCEQNIATDPNHCGTCTTVCSSTNMATRTCGSGVCNGTCNAGYDDCDNNKQTTGCEVNIATNADNCGACGTICSNNHMATRTCGSGLCNGTCSAGYGDCDSDKQLNGCEISTTNNVSNCGSCGTVCNLPNAVEVCANSVCGIASCTSGYDDCNNTVGDGCEININTDTSNCGACTRACDNAHVSGALSCTAGLCDTSACDSGWANNLKPAAPAADDGCEGH